MVKTASLGSLAHRLINRVAFVDTMSAKLSKADLDEVVNRLDDSVRTHVAAAFDNQHYSDHRHRRKRTRFDSPGRCEYHRAVEFSRQDSYHRGRDQFYTDETGSEYSDSYTDDYSDDYSDDEYRIVPNDLANATTPTGGVDDHTISSPSLKGFAQSCQDQSAQEVPDPTTDEIDPLLLDLVTKWMHGYLPPTEIRKLQDKCLRPANVLAAKPITINPELSRAIAKQGVELDKPLSYINLAIAKGCQPLISAWSTIAVAVSKFRDEKGKDTPAVFAIGENNSLDLDAIQDLVTTALMVLGNANQQTAQYRRDQFKPFLHYDYHELLHHAHPLTTQLFGDNIKEKIGDISKIKQVVRHLPRTPRKRGRKSRRGHRRDFLDGRGGGGGRRFRRSCRGNRGGSQSSSSTTSTGSKPQGPQRGGKSSGRK